eukprot:gnl/TRDRNA2_/TRDRNA2_155699_c0_seq2.p1 gnl/TRDRNA2_/TRDRNA2_155699_c0~~gnl/TRDRNA2_/TRDRNA2_155699_c0_seq2.p1  ORF type:complete len:158 (+),score=36.52 gnl/TRDRNA2_/TRDRNA2_155699_c0_seq2:617-1090(+)
MLHMTAFYLGGEELLAPDARRALELEGTKWPVRPLHLVYAAGALLVATLEVTADGLPTEPDCIPHVTLLTRRPFGPVDANDALDAALSAGLLDGLFGSTNREQGEILVLPQASVGCTYLDLYVQRLAASSPEHQEGCSAADAGGPLMPARLESFWNH